MSKNIEQVVARLNLEEFEIFRNARLASGMSESSFVIQMIHEFFEGGCLNTTENKLIHLENEINRLEQLIEVKA